MAGEIRAQMSSSNARIRRGFITAILIATSVARPPISAISPPLIPVEAASLRRPESLRCVQGRPDVPGGLLPLHNLQSQTPSRMIRDVAMHQPRSWVVSLEGNDNVSISGSRRTSRRGGLSNFKFNLSGNVAFSIC